MDNKVAGYIFGESSAPEVTALESAADRDAIVLTALEESFDSPEEYVNFLMENITTMQLYGIVSNDPALEASVKKMRTVISVQSQMSRAQKKAAIRLAKANNDPNYAKYTKYKALFREYRQKLYDKYGNKGKAIARKELQNAGHKAKSIHTNAGKQMGDRIQSVIDKTDKSGRNGTAIKKD